MLLKLRKISFYKLSRIRDVIENHKDTNLHVLLFLMKCFCIHISNIQIAVVTSFPIMQVEQFRPHGPGITPDDIIRDSVPFMDNGVVRSWSLKSS